MGKVITSDFVETHIVSPLLSLGHSVQTVGSIATNGYSTKDVDLLLDLRSEEQFEKFLVDLDSIGFFYEGSNENEEHPEWGVFHVFYSKSANVCVDVFICEMI